MKVFDKNDLKDLFVPKPDSSGEQNGQVTIIGGSTLFHGAPLFALKVASRVVDMVFFATPEKSVGQIAEKAKSKLMSFIWIPWEDVEKYIEKSDAVLMGPGFMRFGSESTPEKERGFENHDEGKQSREITKRLLQRFLDKKWVIDAGSLQVMDADWIPEGSIVTPNRKEFELLFKVKLPVKGDEYFEADVDDKVSDFARKYKCTIILKGPKTIVASPEHSREIRGGNAGMTKGGTGDVLAGLTVALLAKNDAFLSACAASYVVKAAADDLYKKAGVYYNSDDLANQIPSTLDSMLR